jgi:hypothetical protein
VSLCCETFQCNRRENNNKRNIVDMIELNGKTRIEMKRSNTKNERHVSRWMIHARTQERERREREKKREREKDVTKEFQLGLGNVSQINGLPE